MVRVGIAGVRHPHIDAVFAEAAARDDMAIVAIADPDEASRTAYATKYGGTEYRSHLDMLDREPIDAIVIGAVFGERGPIVVDALERGIHVLADKPLCTTFAELDRISVAAAASAGTLSMMLEKRFYPATLALRPILADLGELAVIASNGPHKLTRARRPDWMFHPATYGGILADLAVHDLDLVLHLTGATAGEINGYVGNSAITDRPQFEDHGVAVLRLAGGPIATIEANWLSPEAAPYHGDYRMRLTGSRGTAELLWKDNRLLVATHDRAPYEPDLPPGLRPAQDFFDALAGGRAPTITARDTLDATRLALLAQASAADGVTRTFDLEH